MSQTLTERLAGNRTAGDLMRWLIVGIATVIIAAGLFALGRWTAPSTELGAEASAPPLKATGLGPPGSIDPAVMPSKAVQQILERVYLGTPLASDRTQATSLGPPGSIDPAVMPSKAVQQVLEHIYLGTPFPRKANR